MKDHATRLLATYEKFVNSLLSGEQWDQDSYLNELDGRRILQEEGEHLTEDQREKLGSLDHSLNAATEAGDCLWGAKIEKKEGWTRHDHPWYYRWPTGGFLD